MNINLISNLPYGKFFSIYLKEYIMEDKKNASNEWHKFKF